MERLGRGANRTRISLPVGWDRDSGGVFSGEGDGNRPNTTVKGLKRKENFEFGNPAETEAHGGIGSHPSLFTLVLDTG
jgi:hypothetical protein